MSRRPLQFTFSACLVKHQGKHFFGRYTVRIITRVTSTFADSQNFFKIHKKTPILEAVFKISIFKLY